MKTVIIVALVALVAIVVMIQPSVDAPKLDVKPIGQAAANPWGCDETRVSVTRIADTEQEAICIHDCARQWDSDFRFLLRLRTWGDLGGEYGNGYSNEEFAEDMCRLTREFNQCAIDCGE